MDGNIWIFWESIFSCWPITEPPDDGTGDKLEEGEDGAEEATKQHRVELHRGAHTSAEPVHLD